MRTNRRTRLLLALAILLFAAVLLSGIWFLLKQKLAVPFALDGTPVVGKRIFSDIGLRPPAGAVMLHDWPTIGDPVPLPDQLAVEARNVLGSSDTYTLQIGQCFEPGMAISFGQGPNRVDVLICLLCDRAVFYRAGVETGLRLSKEGHKKLTSIYVRLFQMPPPQL